MRNFLFFMVAFLFCFDAAAKCEYSGNRGLKAFNISAKVLSDPSIPVGTILYSKGYGVGTYKTFECNKIFDDQYIIDVGANEVSGVTGIRGYPVYETGIEGLGFQVSDLVLSKAGNVIPAKEGSTVVPVDDYDGSNKLITVWLVKTAAVIGTGSANSPVVSFSAGNLATNPSAAERLLLSITLNFSKLTYKSTSCDLSVAGSSQVTLKTIDKKELMNVAQGGTTSAKRDITMNLTCPSESVGNTVRYWFNPVGGTSDSGNGIIDNMITGATAASNVDVIFKIGNKPIEFFDSESYGFNKVTESETFTFSADYYRSSSSSADVTAGKVKAMIEVIIQEE